MCAMTMTEERLYTAEEVAHLLRVHPRTVHRMIKRGELDAFTVGGIYRIRQSALDTLMQRKPKKEDRTV